MVSGTCGCWNCFSSTPLGFMEYWGIYRAKRRCGRPPRWAQPTRACLGRSFFGTNLLTQCLVPVVVFCLFFTSQKINTKRSPNATKLFGEFFWTRRHLLGQRSTRGGLRGEHNPPGHAWGPRRAMVGCAHLGRLPHRLFAL